MNYIEKLKVAAWSARPLPLEQKLRRGCPLCKSPLKLAEGEAERVAEDTERKMDEMQAIQRGNIVEMARHASRMNPAMAVRFECTKEGCPFNGE
jgi:hypothetical protein